MKCVSFFLAGLDGRFRGGTRLKGIRNFHAADNSLMAIRLDTWGPFIFANLDPSRCGQHCMVHSLAHAIVQFCSHVTTGNLLNKTLHAPGQGLGYMHSPISLTQRQAIPILPICPSLYRLYSSGYPNLHRHSENSLAAEAVSMEDLVLLFAQEKCHLQTLMSQIEL